MGLCWYSYKYHSLLFILFLVKCFAVKRRKERMKEITCRIPVVDKTLIPDRTPVSV